MFFRALPFLLQVASIVIGLFALRFQFSAAEDFQKANYHKAHARMNLAVVTWAVSGVFAQASIIVLFFQVHSSD